MPQIWIIQNLSLADLGHGIVVILPSVISNMYHNTWPLGELLCRLTFANKYTFLIANVQLIVLMSLNRLYRCTYPLQSAATPTQPSHKLAVSLGVALASIVVPMWTTFISFYNRAEIGYIAYSSIQSQCQFEVHVNTTWRVVDMVFEKAAFAVFDFIPTMVMIASNVMLISIALKTRSSIGRNRRNHKSIIVILVTVTFLFTTLPLFGWHYLYSNSNPIAFNKHFARSIVCCKLLPSFANPIIYYSNNKFFRRFTISRVVGVLARVPRVRNILPSIRISSVRTSTAGPSNQR